MEVKEIKEIQSEVLFPPIQRELNLDELYRLRASSNVANLEYVRTGRKDVPFYIYPKGKKGLPIAYVAGEELAKYFCRINDIVDLAIKHILDNQKLQREVSRVRKNNAPSF